MKDFIRDNLFVVALAVVTVVCVGGLIALLVSLSQQRNQSIQQLVAKHTEARRFPRVNEAMLAEQRRRNERVEQERKKIETILAAQAKDYPPIRVQAGGRNVYALPYDRQRYNDLRLDFKVSRRYVNAWDEWMDRLRSTRPATVSEDFDDYYARRVRHWRRVLLDRLIERIDKVGELIDKAALNEVRTHIYELRQELKPVEEKLDRAGFATEDTASGVAVEDVSPEVRALLRQRDTLQAKINAWGARQTGLIELKTMLTPARQDIAETRETLGEMDQIAERLAEARRAEADAETLARLRDRMDQQRGLYQDLAGRVMNSAEQRASLLAGLFDLVEPEDTPSRRRRPTRRAPRTPEEWTEEDMHRYDTPPDTRVPGEYRRSSTPTTDVDVTIRMDKQRRDAAERILHRRIDLQAAEEYAWPDAKLQQARSGRIYADTTALDRYFPEDEYNLNPTELWQMQVNKWVQTDILEAIQGTNEEVLGSLPDEAQNVLHAAVKRLVSVRVARRYYTSGEAPESPAIEAPEYGDMERAMGGEPGAWGGAYTPRARTAQARGGTLTGHVCSKDFDVVHYGFTVIMPERHVARLMRHLTRDTYHTVLQCELAQVGESDPIELPGGLEARETRRTSGGADERREPGEYYYGPEPVLAVTFVGELLLQTDWARGKPNPDKDAETPWLIWDPDRDPKDPWRPSPRPLIPPQALAAMVGADALRKADKELLNIDEDGRTRRTLGGR
ncbi:MAG: hypothetical protein ACOC8F_03520 [Planctomycetota bacterium]